MTGVSTCVSGIEPYACVRGPGARRERHECERLEWCGGMPNLPGSELACHRPPVINVKRPSWKHCACDLALEDGRKQKTHENERDTCKQFTEIYFYAK